MVVGLGASAVDVETSVALPFKELADAEAKQTNQINFKIVREVLHIQHVQKTEKNTSNPNQGAWKGFLEKLTFGLSLAEWNANFISCTWPLCSSNKMDAEEVVLEHKPQQELRSGLVVSLYFNTKTIFRLSTVLAPHSRTTESTKNSDGVYLQENYNLIRQ